MSRSKIVDEGEVIRWYNEGKTYAWMVEEYRNKYNIETTSSMWGNFRRTRGLDRRITRDDDLIPWEVSREHRWNHPLTMLRFEARVRAGRELREQDQRHLDAWKAELDELGAVVHYDPDTTEGWFYVPRREGVDKDIIREPARKTSSRLAAD